MVDKSTRVESNGVHCTDWCQTGGPMDDRNNRPEMDTGQGRWGRVYV